MPTYLVVTEQYDSSAIHSPPEWGADVVEVEAEDREEAVVKGVRKMRSEYPNGLINQLHDKNPFGLIKKVEKLED